MILIILICISAVVSLTCLYAILIQNITASRRKTKDRVLDLTNDNQNVDKKREKKQFKFKKKNKKKQVSVFSKTRKGFQQIEDELYNLKINMSVQTFITLWIAMTIGIPMLLMMAGVDIIIWIVIATIVAFGPFLFFRIKKKKRKEVLEKQLIEGIMLICNVLRAGHSFETAMNNIATDMEGPLAEEFERVFRETQRGVNFEASMNAMSERIGSSDLEMLCQTILIQRRVGGNLAEVLENIAGTVQSRMNLKEEIKTLTSSGKMSGYIIGALPIFLVILISVINPLYTKPLFTTTIGHIMLLISAVLEILGFVVINKIVDIDY